MNEQLEDRILQLERALEDVLEAFDTGGKDGIYIEVEVRNYIDDPEIVITDGKVNDVTQQAIENALYVLYSEGDE